MRVHAIGLMRHGSSNLPHSASQGSDESRMRPQLALTSSYRAARTFQLAWAARSASGRLAAAATTILSSVGSPDMLTAVYTTDAGVLRAREWAPPAAP